MQSEGSRTPYSHPHNLTISQESLNKISKIHTTDCFLKYLKSLTWQTNSETFGVTFVDCEMLIKQSALQ